MASLAEIEALLNIEIGDKKLKDGKKRKNKNQYYYYEQAYYIVKLTRDKWMIAEDCRTTRKLLRKYCWSASTIGYGVTRVNRTLKYWHQLFLNYEAGLVADHINNKKFDNRSENLRVVTYSQNSRNMSKRSDNTSGKQGVSRYTDKKSGEHYWRVYIRDNTGKRKQKYFSIKKLGDAEAKRQAIAHRIALEQQYGYLGD